MPPLNRICVLRLTALGDCINAFGLICALLNTYHQLEITWIIDKRFISLFEGHKKQARLTLVGVDFKHGFFKALIQLRKELAGQHFDALFNLQTSIKASLCSLFIHAKQRLGYDKYRAREGQFLFINKKVPSPANPHVLAGFMAFPKSCGMGALEPCWDFCLSAEERAPFIKQFEHKSVFLISPASAKSCKNWTVPGYIAIAQHAISQGMFVVLSGGNAALEQQLCSQIVAALPAAACTNLCGKTRLRELLALVSISKLVLSPDSACAHLASALDIPVIGLYAVHDPKRVGSWNYPQLWVSVYHKLALKELGGRHIPWRYRVKNPLAMTEISIDDVIVAFDKAQQLII